MDRMLYIVICNHRDGQFTPERQLADMGRATTIEDIADGEIKNVAKVIEFNPAEHTSRDVTEDICNDVCELWVRESVAPDDWRVEFFEFTRGAVAANAFARAA